MGIVYLKHDDILYLHDRLIERDGGLYGIREPRLLSSILMIPQMTFSGEDLYPTVIDKSACYLYFMIKNHPFNDANKRTGVMCFLHFLDINNYNIEVIDLKRLESTAVCIASTKKPFEEDLVLIKELCIK